MKKEQYDLISKIHNELIKRTGIEPDKYEREDVFFGVIHDVENGLRDMKESFIHAFDVVYAVEVTDRLYNSCYELCRGFRNFKE